MSHIWSPYAFLCQKTILIRKVIFLFSLCMHMLGASKSNLSNFFFAPPSKRKCMYWIAFVFETVSIKFWNKWKHAMLQKIICKVNEYDFFLLPALHLVQQEFSIKCLKQLRGNGCEWGSWASICIWCINHYSQKTHTQQPQSDTEDTQRRRPKKMNWSNLKVNAVRLITCRLLIFACNSRLLDVYSIRSVLFRTPHRRKMLCSVSSCPLRLQILLVTCGTFFSPFHFRFLLTTSA